MPKQTEEPVEQTEAPPEPEQDDDVEAVEAEVVDEGAEPTESEQEQMAADAAAEPEEEVVVSQALAVVEEREKSLASAPSVLPTPQEWAATRAMAESIAATKFVPADYRNRPDEVLAAILFGREIGIGPMQSLRDVAMIDGRPALAAHRQLALLRRGGVEILESESTATRASIRARRRDTGEAMTVEWTIEEAQQITRKGKKLVDGDNWRNYPADMLWARCVGRLGRRLAPDLIGGMAYTAEEIRDFDDAPVDGDYEPIARGPQPTAVEKLPEFSSWRDAASKLASVGVDPEWLAEATQALATDEERTQAEDSSHVRIGEISEETQRKIWVGAKAVYVAIEKATGGEGSFPPPDRQTIAVAWKDALGVGLKGPSHALSPDEAEAGFPPNPNAPTAPPPQGAATESLPEQAGMDAPGGDRESGPNSEVDRDAIEPDGSAEDVDLPFDGSRSAE